MKLIRWLLSNIVLIAFVLAITYAYVYWDNLTGEDTPAGKAIAYLSVEYDEVREFLDGYDFGDGEADVIGEAKPVAEVAETASVPQVMPPPRSLPPQQPAVPAQARQQQAVSQPSYQQPVPPQAMMRPPTARQQQPISQPSYQQPVPPQAMMRPPTARQQQPVPQPSYQQPVPPQAMMQPPTARQQQPVPQPSYQQPAPPQAMMPPPAETAAQSGDPESELRALWISAREEYHRGNIAQSITNYQQVIANSSDNYDAYGELGNVYLSRGKYTEAAGAYYQAAVILVKQGQMGRARSLLPMLERLDRARADELNQLMNAPRS